MSYESHENPLWYNFLTLIWGWIPWTLVLLVSLFGLKWKEMHVLPEGDSVGERLKKCGINSALNHRCSFYMGGDSDYLHLLLYP